MSGLDNSRWNSSIRELSRQADEEDRAAWRQGTRGRRDTPPLRKRARSRSASPPRGHAQDRWTRRHEFDESKRGSDSDRFAPSTSPRRDRYARETVTETSPRSPQPTSRRRPRTPDQEPSPNRNMRPPAVPIKISWSVDARPTRNAHGEVVMVEYDHALVQHRRSGGELESFDTRKLRYRPLLPPRQRWLNIQSYLRSYGVIDDQDLINPNESPTRSGQSRSSATRALSESSERRTASSPTVAASNADRVEVALERERRSTSLAHSPVDAARPGPSSTASNSPGVPIQESLKAPNAGTNDASIDEPTSAPIDRSCVAESDQAPPTSPSPDQPDDALPNGSTLDAIPCLVSSAQSPQITVPADPTLDSSFQAALALLPPVSDAEPEDPVLGLFDKAITHCRNLVAVVDDVKIRRKLRDTAVEMDGPGD